MDGGRSSDETVLPVTQENVDVEDNEVSGSQVKRRKRKRKRKQDSDKQSNATSTPLPSDADHHHSPAMLDQTVYIEGIPFDCTRDQVREFFTSTLNLTDVVDLRLPQWQDSGRLRGYGHVVFSTQQSRNEAIKQSGKHYLNNRYVTIQQAKPPTLSSHNSNLSNGITGGNSNHAAIPRPQPDNCRTIFCRNLPYSATAQDIEELFRSCGKIVDGGVRIAWNYKTKQSKGFCYIEFKNPEGAYGAVTSKIPWVLQGRVCQVDYDEGSIKGSYKTETGRLWTKEYHHDQHRQTTTKASTTMIDNSNKKRKTSEK